MDIKWIYSNKTSVRRNLTHVWLLAGITILCMPGGASASLIGFQTEVNTGSKFAIRNTSSDGIQIQSVSVTLGENTLFDTALGGAGIDPVDPALSIDRSISIAHWDDADTTNVLRDATGFGDFFDVTSTWNTSTGGNTDYAGVLSADVIDGAITMTLLFNDFDPDEAWGFSVDYDSRDGDEEAAGSDMNNALVEVIFFDPVSGLTHTLTSQYGTFGGKKRSFPTDFLDAEGNNVGPTAEFSAVPVPASVWLFVSGLMGMIGISRRGRLTRS